MSCATTEDLPILGGIIGQDRAVKALKFGLDIKERGFNIYVAGYPGTGRKTAVMGFLEEVAKTKPVPSDWCYVNNFSNTYEPKAIRLPPGKGKVFQKDMKDFIDGSRKGLQKVFESEDYASKRESTIAAVEAERRKLFDELNKKAQEQGFVIQTSPMGLIMVPVIKGQPLSDEEFDSLTPKMKDEIHKRRDTLGADLRTAIRQLRQLGGKADESLVKLNRDVGLYTIETLDSELSQKYKEFPDVLVYVDAVRDNILENLDQFIRDPKAAAAQQLPFQPQWLGELPFRKYEVNVIVDNSDLKGAPVISERNPTYPNLLGRIEKEAQFGILTTDFTMIRGGSLHKANGGFIVLTIEELFSNAFSYDSLKRALTNEKINIEEVGERLGYITTKGLRPESIPLDVKVILIGDPFVYQQIYSIDTQFKELFKVKSEFDTSMNRTDENVLKYASFICTFCTKESIRHLDASGVAKIVEYGSRLADDQEKLSTRFSEVADILREACFYATQDNSPNITGAHVKKAIEEKVYRSNMIQEKIHEMIERRVILIETEGEAVGQVNGLFVMGFGDFSFGSPSKVTASIGLGSEGVIDIQREAKLGGPIHTKGVMILSGYLSEKFAQDKPLTLSASLTFEQSYGMVEGDSASSTELYSILSALSGVPIKQNFAVTGSVNQKGEVQAIGGVNEKLEGFFEVCKAKGLNGKHSALIPDSNVQNLMLKEEIVDAVRIGKFHIYSAKTIDEGIEILTGVKAGKRQSDGTFEEGTINYKIDKRLREMAERLKEFSETATKKRDEKE
ncbi:MAG: hypothetical protein QG670_490 [Thermoproteota archaeon]|nr:hypothetical protein [Thermoproteota archaeon]